MKIALIITTIFLILSFMIRNELSKMCKQNPIEYLANYKSYNLIASINGVVFLVSLVFEIILLANIFVK